ncbi:MAG: hypothetical protein KC553_08465 [Nitrospina sp.]|nr:hypothetical protein [Nitrospina sp.]
MSKTLGIRLTVLFLLGILVTGCSSLPPTRDVAAQKPAKEMGMSPTEYMALDEPEDTYWD